MRYVLLSSLILLLFSCGEKPPVEPSRFEPFTYKSSELTESKSGQVYLPPSYFTDTLRQYPVLYMMDQQNLFFDSLAYGGAAWQIHRTTDSLSSAGQMPEVIIVGVNHAREKRFQEYLPEKPAACFDSLLEARVGGTAFSDAYLKFLTQELKPYVDRTYRTKPGKGHTYIGGSSMGGLISMYAVCEYPDVFAGALCLSTHWPVSLQDDTPEVAQAIIDYFAAHLPKGKRWYFDYGTEGLDQFYAPYQQQVDSILQAQGYQAGQNWMTQAYPGHDHNERYWRERVHLGLRGVIQE
ncbi:MAG: alpha/beta hydrolase [Phaeodactylibacter xiamenensis]|uniref:alpha/beta hydrolase n=1 Tax=Phaeodactylibacter xiamenensis TaxID=1524460 RepID=UPI000695FBDB|nr:alpha/beta hydrolase-fold protein [Phaeodactylibacter xiamenensis]MCR9050292.1 alpha/beta hydrolase-fold protein [bacterium]